MKNRLALFLAVLVLGVCVILKAYADNAMTIEDRAKLGKIYSLERLKEYAKVNPMIKDLRQRYPDNREIEWTYVRVLGFGGNWKEATDAFNQLCAKDCAEEMFVTYAHILESQGPHPETLPLIKKLSDQYPDQKEIHLVYSEILSWNTQNPEGCRALEALSAEFSDDLRIAEALGDVAYAAKDYASAQKGYEKILESQPSAAMRKKYADTLVAQEKYADAINQMDVLISSAPDDQDLRYQHAQVVAATGDHEQAVKELQALLQDGFNKKEAMVMLGDEFRLLGRDEEALKVYQEVADEE